MKDVPKKRQVYNHQGGYNICGKYGHYSWLAPFF